MPVPDAHCRRADGGQHRGAELPTEAQLKAGSLDVDGQKITLKLEHEGGPSVAHAWRFADRAWNRVESKPTDEGWDMALEVRALDTFSTLGPRTAALLEPHLGGGDLEPATAKLLEQKTHKSPSPEDGNWVEGHTTAGAFYVWMANVEFSWSTGLIRFADTTMPPDLGFTEGDLVGLQTRGPYLLVASAHAGAYPRVYDLRSRALVYSKDGARAAVFWPEP